MILKKFCRLQTTDLIRHAVLAWFFAVTAELLLLPGRLRALDGLDGLAKMSFVRVCVLTIALTVALYVLSRYRDTKQLERRGIVGIFALLSAICLCASFTWGMLIACSLFCTILFFYARFGSDRSKELLCIGEKADKKYFRITLGLSLLFFVFVSVWTVCRVYSMSVHTFDFGLFAQMFHKMKETGAPMTTLERDGWLSHFYVHMSPIYYLLLPFYCLFPHAETLQVLQAAVITSAVIPLWKIARLHGLSPKMRTIVCALLLFFPAFSGGAGFDLHENCFLTPLILWLFYGLDSKKLPITVIAALLTLAVKEDAPVYVAVIAIWFLVKTALQKGSKKDLLLGFGLLATALAWFYAATSFLAEVGDGVMNYRYENFMYDGSESLLTVVKSVVLNPMKALYESVENEKLKFIALTMSPLLFLPFATRKYARFLLLIPYFLINLMSDYKYQHSIHFQYVFGSLAFLMYLTVVNLAELRIEKHRLCAGAAALLVSMSLFGIFIVPRAVQYPDESIRNHEYYTTVRRALSQIPKETTVTASSFYTTELVDRSVVYDLTYCSEAHLLSSEYVALQIKDTGSFTNYDSSEGAQDGFERLCVLLERNGYEVFCTLGDELVIYRK